MGGGGPLVQRRVLSVMWLVWVLWCCLLSIHHVDAALSQALRAAPAGLRDLFGVITVAGLGKWYIWPAALAALGCAGFASTVKDAERALWYRRLAWALGFVALAVLISGLASDLIKVLVGRARPKLLAQATYYGFLPIGLRADYQSFPSGHATTGAALGLAVAVLLPRLRWVGLAFALTIAASRVILNAHFLGDVMGGAAIGCFTVWWLRDWYAAHGVLFVHEADGAVRRIGLSPAPPPDGDPGR